MRKSMPCKSNKDGERMKKLIIVARSNDKDKVYVKLKASKNSILQLYEMFKEVDEFFLDYEEEEGKKLTNYNKWKDEQLSLESKDFEVDIICGDKYIHIFFRKFKNYKVINKLLDNNCEWIKVKLSKKMKERIK